MKHGIAALILMTVTLLVIAPTKRSTPNSLSAISWVTPSWAQDVPPSATAPQSQSDQPEVIPTSPQLEVQFTTQQSGSASATDVQQVVPMAQKVDPLVSNQPAGSEASK